MPRIAAARALSLRVSSRRLSRCVMIDMQRDFLEPGGFGAALGNDVSRLAPPSRRRRALLAAFRRPGCRSSTRREAHRADLSDCPPAKRTRGGARCASATRARWAASWWRGEPGVDIIPALAPAPASSVIDKPGKGAFYATGLASFARARITHLVVGGVTTEVCVQTTLREANDRGYECLLVEDATESYFPEFKAATLGHGARSRRHRRLDRDRRSGDRRAGGIVTDARCLRHALGLSGSASNPARSVSPSGCRGDGVLRATAAGELAHYGTAACNFRSSGSAYCGRNGCGWRAASADDSPLALVEHFVLKKRRESHEVPAPEPDVEALPAIPAAHPCTRRRG